MSRQVFKTYCNRTVNTALGCRSDFYQIFPQSCGQQWRFYSSYAGRNNPSRAILHSRCSSHRWVEINYQHWLLCYWARSLRSSKLPSHCPYLHPKDPLEIVFLVQKALLLQEQPVFFSRNVTQSCIFSHGVFFFYVCVAWANILISTKDSEKIDYA